MTYCNNNSCPESATRCCLNCDKGICDKCWEENGLCADCQNAYTYCEMCGKYVEKINMADGIWCQKCTKEEMSVSLDYEELESKVIMMQTELNAAKKLLNQMLPCDENEAIVWWGGKMLYKCEIEKIQKFLGKKYST